MDYILNQFISLYGTMHSGILVDGDPSCDERSTVTVRDPNLMDRVFTCEPASDDDGFFHYVMDDTLARILIPIP